MDQAAILVFLVSLNVAVWKELVGKQVLGAFNNYIETAKVSTIIRPEKKNNMSQTIVCLTNPHRNPIKFKYADYRSFCP